MSRICSFWVDRFLFGIDIQQVVEIIRSQPLTHVPLAPPCVRGLMNLRGRIVASIDLRTRLELPPRAREVGDSASAEELGNKEINIILETPDGLVSLIADRVGEVVEVSADEFEAAPDMLQGVPRQLIRGSYRRERGLILLLDAVATTRVAA